MLINYDIILATIFLVKVKTIKKSIYFLANDTIE